MRNKYEGTCRSCGIHVPVGAGYYAGSVYCTGCHGKAPPAARPAQSRPAPANAVRALTEKGEVRTPYEPENLPLMRAFPGARWNPDAKCWTVSLTDADLPRVIEIADKLKLDVPAALRQRAGVKTLQAAAVASDPRLFPFQVKGVDFLSRHDKALLGDEMGCIDGEAVVRLNRAGKGFALKLSDLCHRFNGGATRGGKHWDLSIPTYIRSLCSGELRLNLVKRVLNKGVKPVLKLTLASGKALRLTPDHEVFGESGWVRADALKRGDKITTNGKPACKLCGSTENVSVYPYAKFIGHCRRCISRTLRAKPTYKRGWHFDKSGYVMVTAQYDHPRRDLNNHVREHVLVMEKILGRYLKDGERIHHIDGNRSNNTPENLQLVDASKHARIHGGSGGYRSMNGGRGGKGGLVQFVPTIDTVVSVVPDGEAHVYDVVCDDPHRNFVANGIVVHNCGKTVQTLCAMGEGWKVLVICPATLKFNWAAEAAKWAPKYRVSVLEGRDSWRWPEAGEMVIVNYSIMPSYLKHDLRKLKATEGKEVEAMAVEAALAGIPTGLSLIVDESHNVKSNKADRSRATRQLSVRAARVWALTGTPLLNRAMDLWGMLNNLDLAKAVFGGWPTFTKLYGATKNRWGGYEFTLPGPEVAERLRRVMLRRLRKDVLPDLPDKLVKTITVNGLDGSLREDLDDLWEEYEEEVEEGKLPPFEKFSAVRARLAESRIPALDELVDDYEEQETPLIVFSAHKAPVLHIAQRKGWASITGETAPADRQSIVEQFQGGKLKGVALTIAAGGVGITLTHASNVVFCDLDWTPALNQQAEDRVARIGQKANKITITRLQSNHPMDLHVTALIGEKIALIDASIEAEAIPVIPTASAIRVEQTSHVSKEENSDLLTALKIVSGVCDGAHAKDNIGFNGTDSAFGKSLATRTYLTDRQAEAARRMLRKYRRQIPADLYTRLYPEAEKKGKAKP